MKRIKQRKLVGSHSGGVAVNGRQVAITCQSGVMFFPRGIRHESVEIRMPGKPELVGISPDGQYVASLGRDKLSVVRVSRQGYFSDNQTFDLDEDRPTSLAVGNDYIALSQSIGGLDVGRSRLHYFRICSADGKNLERLHWCEMDYDGRVSVVVASEELEEGTPGHRVMARFVMAGRGETAGEFAITEADEPE